MPRVTWTRTIAWIVVAVLGLLILVTLAYMLVPKPDETLAVMAFVVG